MGTAKGMLCLSPPGQSWCKAWHGGGLKLPLQALVAARYCTWNCWAWSSLLETDKQVHQKAKGTHPPGWAVPSPSRGTSPASRAETILALALLWDFSHCFFHNNLPFLPSFAPELRNFMANKANAEETVGVGWRGMLPLQAEASMSAAQAQEPGSAEGLPAMWTWICHVRVGGQNLTEDTFLSDCPLPSEGRSHRRALCSERNIYI